jgi:hypothetical protein
VAALAVPIRAAALVVMLGPVLTGAEEYEVLQPVV